MNHEESLRCMELIREFNEQQSKYIERKIMKQPFKVGDRVAVYSCGCRLTGPIIEINGNGLIQLDVDKRSGNFWYSPKQCRRLIPKTRREIWIIRHPGQDADDCSTPYRVAWSKGTAEAMRKKYSEGFNPLLHFIEAKK